MGKLVIIVTAAVVGVALTLVATADFGLTDIQEHDAAMAVAAPAPTIPCGGASKGIFYGIDGHIQQGGVYGMRDYAQQLAQVRELGMTLYAQDISDRDAAEKVARLARMARGQCLAILAVLTPDLAKLPDEAAAYRDGYKLGHDSAEVLKGLVEDYQVGNEYDNLAIRRGHGKDPSDYDNAVFMKARGSILGMIDGIKSADPQAKIALCSLGWLHYGFSDMLYTGTQPDGSKGHRIPQWDITAWHWYSDMGDITFARGNNVLKHLRDTYHKPIWITEYGARPDLGESDAAAYLISLNGLAGYVANARKYGIQAVFMYELYDDQAYGGDGDYGLFRDDGLTRKPRFDIVKSFIKTHPMP
jgi:Glycosyl hydrolase catalytic core